MRSCAEAASPLLPNGDPHHNRRHGARPRAGLRRSGGSGPLPGNATRRTRGDIRHAVELALKSLPDKTQEQVAEQVGCTRQYVTKIKCQLATSCELPDAPATVTGKDGKTYPTSKPLPARSAPGGVILTETASTECEALAWRWRALPGNGLQVVGIIREAIEHRTLRSGNGLFERCPPADPIVTRHPRQRRRCGR